MADTPPSCHSIATSSVGRPSASGFHLQRSLRWRSAALRDLRRSAFGIRLSPSTLAPLALRSSLTSVGRPSGRRAAAPGPPPRSWRRASTSWSPSSTTHPVGSPAASSRKPACTAVVEPAAGRLEPVQRTVEPPRRDVRGHLEQDDQVGLQTRGRPARDRRSPRAGGRGRTPGTRPRSAGIDRSRRGARTRARAGSPRRRAGPSPPQEQGLGPLDTGSASFSRTRCRMRSPSPVPPGSRVSSAPSREARSRAWVDLPVPSPPSNAMNRPRPAPARSSSPTLTRRRGAALRRHSAADRRGHGLRRGGARRARMARADAPRMIAAASQRVSRTPGTNTDTLPISNRLSSSSDSDRFPS